MTFQSIDLTSMDFVLILLTLLISFSLVQARETIRVSKSIKINEKMIYDCVDIYKQPSLNHPLLKNHKIQMKPSFAISKSKDKVEYKRSGNINNCPNSTVPILRNTQEYVANAQSVAEKHFNPLTAESHGTHLAGVRLHHGPYHGVGAVISVHDLNIRNDQISYAHVWVGSRVNKEDNFIQTGWMINPTLFGDGRPWTYGVWKGANGGCYNTVCPGFIQVSTDVHISEPVPPGPDGKRNIGVTIQQDKTTGNWWRTDVGNNKQIGYWPKELFDFVGTNRGADMVGVGGAVESSPSGNSPPMGNGHLPTKNDMDSARIQDMTYMGSDSIFHKADVTKMEKLLDSEKCYGMKRGRDNLLLFGGPGGDSCGI